MFSSVARVMLYYYLPLLDHPPFEQTEREPNRQISPQHAMSVAHSSAMSALAAPRYHASRTRQVSRPRVACASSSSASNADDVAQTPKAAVTSRRAALARAVALGAILRADDARAIGFQKELKKRGPMSDDAYARTAEFEFRGERHEGVKYVEISEGKGKPLEVGALATLHFECKYRGLTVLSTREARTLGGNRTISEPFQFKYGTLPNEFTKAAKRKNIIGIGAEVRIDPELQELYVVKCVFNGPADRAGIKPNDVVVSIDGVGDLVNKPIQEIGALLVGDVDTEVELKIKKGGSRAGADAPIETYKLKREVTAVAAPKREIQVDGGGGLFTGGSGPKPPPLVYVPEALAGMSVGGRRSFKCPADVGYEDVGEGEIPPGADFVFEVELLDAVLK